MTETFGSSGAHVGGTTPTSGTTSTGSSSTGTTGTGSIGTEPTSTGSSATRDVAKDEAKGVAQDAVQGGKQTAETAKQQAGEVAGEAKNQARALVDQTREELASQSSQQQQRAATGLRSMADELSSMVNGQGGTGGVASDLARQASERVQTVADWIEQREPRDLLLEVQRFARQRPGAFLAAAGVLGFIGGRVTRGAVDEHRDSSDSEGLYSASQSAGYSTGYESATTYRSATTDYETGGTYAGSAGAAGSSYGSGQVSTAPGTTAPATTTGAASGVGVTGAGAAGSQVGSSYDYAEPAGSAGLSSTTESVSRTAPHGDATASFSPTAPMTGKGENPSEQSLIEDPAGQDRFGGRGGQDPI